MANGQFASEKGKTLGVKQKVFYIGAIYAVKNLKMPPRFMLPVSGKSRF